MPRSDRLPESDYRPREPVQLCLPVYLRLHVNLAHYKYTGVLFIYVAGVAAGYAQLL